MSLCGQQSQLGVFFGQVKIDLGYFGHRGKLGAVEVDREIVASDEDPPSGVGAELFAVFSQDRQWHCHFCRPAVIPVAGIVKRAIDLSCNREPVNRLLATGEPPPAARHEVRGLVSPWSNVHLPVPGAPFRFEENFTDIAEADMLLTVRIAFGYDVGVLELEGSIEKLVVPGEAGSTSLVQAGSFAIEYHRVERVGGGICPDRIIQTAVNNDGGCRVLSIDYGRREFCHRVASGGKGCKTEDRKEKAVMGGHRLKKLVIGHIKSGIL